MRNLINRIRNLRSSPANSAGASSVVTNTSSRLSNVLTQDQQEVQNHLDQLFAVHATLSRSMWEYVKQNEQWYLDLDPEQQDYADRKATARIGINEIAAQTINARQAAQAQHLRNVQQENDEREELARQLREETERCQDLIESKIAEAQDHLDNRRYRESINVATEGQDLLTGKKGGAIQATRKGYHKIIKAINGRSNYSDQFVDHVMEGYHLSLQRIIQRAELGLQQSHRTNSTTGNNNVPSGDWVKRNNHFYMESLDYTLQIVRECVVSKGRAFYIVQQSRPVNGEKRFAIMIVDDWGQPTQSIQIEDTLGFVIDVKLQPIVAGLKGNSTGFRGKILVQREMNTPMEEFVSLVEPSAPTAVTATAANAEAEVSFTPPAAPRGAPIEGYQVVAMPGNIVASGNTSPITVTGLTNGTAYTFTVKAKNTLGFSPASAPSAPVTPVDPAAPAPTVTPVVGMGAGAGAALAAALAAATPTPAPVATSVSSPLPVARTAPTSAAPITVVSTTLGPVARPTVSVIPRSLTGLKVVSAVVPRSIPASSVVTSVASASTTATDPMKGTGKNISTIRRSFDKQLGSLELMSKEIANRKAGLRTDASPKELRQEMIATKRNFLRLKRRLQELHKRLEDVDKDKYARWIEQINEMLKEVDICLEKANTLFVDFDAPRPSVTRARTAVVTGMTAPDFFALRDALNAVWDVMNTCKDDLWTRVEELNEIEGEENQKNEAQILLDTIVEKKNSLELAYAELNSEEMLRIIGTDTEHKMKKRLDDTARAHEVVLKKLQYNETSLNNKYFTDKKVGPATPKKAAIAAKPPVSVVDEISVLPTVALEKINDPELIKARLLHLWNSFYLFSYSRPVKEMEGTDISNVKVSLTELKGEDVDRFMDAMSKAKKALGVIIVPRYLGEDALKIQERIQSNLISNAEDEPYVPPFLNVGWTTPKGKVFSFNPLYSGEHPNEKLIFEKLSQLENLVKEREKELSTFEDEEEVLSYDEEGRPKDGRYVIVGQNKKEIKIKNGGIPVSRKRSDIDFLAQDVDKERFTKTDEKWFAIHKKYEDKIVALLKN